jgi:hypothetical protein
LTIIVLTFRNIEEYRREDLAAILEIVSTTFPDAKAMVKNERCERGKLASIELGCLFAI